MSHNTLHFYSVAKACTVAKKNKMFFLATALAIHCKNIVCYVTLRSAHHTVIRVVNTMQCHMIHQLVWYAHCIFYSVPWHVL